MKALLFIVSLALLIFSSPRSTLAQAAAPPVAERAPIAGRILTLDECIAIALEAQPKIQATLYNYAAARYRVTQALAPLLPQLSGSVTATQSQSSASTTSSSTSRQQFPDTFLAQVQLSQLLFDFGKNLAATEAARKLAEVAVEDVELQRQLISLAVKEAYTNILFAGRLIRVQDQAVQRAELNLRSAKGFFEVGTRPKSDVARAEVDVANARVDLIRARNALRTSRVALNTAMAIDVDTPTEVQDNLIFEAVNLDRGQLRTEALQQRPEYRQAKLRVGAAEATERRTVRDFFPDISGTGSYGGTRPQLYESWTLGLTFSWSLFDGGNRLARYQEAKANLEGAKQRVKSTELDIIQNVEQAEIAVEEAQERIQAGQALVDSAQENCRLAQPRFDPGVATVLDPTAAQSTLTQPQTTATQPL